MFDKIKNTLRGKNGNLTDTLGISDAKGAVWNTIGSIAFAASSLIMLAIVSNNATIEESGEFAVTFSLAQFLFIIGLFGSNFFQMTDYQKQYSFSDYRTLKIISSALMLLCGIAAIPLMGFSGRKIWLSLILCVYMMIISGAELFQCLLFQNNRLDLSGKAMFLRTIFSVIPFCAVMILFDNVIAACIVLVISNLIATVIWAVMPSVKFMDRKQSSRATLLPLLKCCLPLFFSELLMNWMIFCPRYLIEIVSDDAVQAIFNMIFIPVQVINLVSSFIFKPILNRLHTLLAERQLGKFIKLIGVQSIFITVLTAAAFLFCLVAGIPVFSFIYGTDLSAYLKPLLLVILSGCAFAFCQMMYYVLVLLRQQKKIMINYAVVSVIAVAAGYFLTERFVITGAVLSFGIAHVILFILHSITAAYQLNKIKRSPEAEGGEL